MGVASTLLGPGDDAAVVAVPDGRVVATTDLLVENRHFRRDWSTANDIGHKAAARNFADIAAMGAVPTALLLGFATPGDVALEWVDGLMAGLREECGEVGAAIIGGDVTAADVITLGVTALGDLQGREPVTLSGARPGDVVALAGKVGWAAAGFAVLGRGFRSPVQVVAAHRRPEPPYGEGPNAADLGATAMTDVSDGLIADLGHLCTASEVGAELHLDALPASATLRAMFAEEQRYVLQATGGDDYELCFTAASTEYAAIVGTALATGVAMTRIGCIVAGRDVVMLDATGQSWQPPRRGFDHFEH